MHEDKDHIVSEYLLHNCLSQLWSIVCLLLVNKQISMFANWARDVCFWWHSRRLRLLAAWFDLFRRKTPAWVQQPRGAVLLIQHRPGWAVLPQLAQLGLYAFPTPWASHPAGVLTPSLDNNLCVIPWWKGSPFLSTKNLYALIFQPPAPCSHAAQALADCVIWPIAGDLILIVSSPGELVGEHPALVSHRRKLDWCTTHWSLQPGWNRLPITDPIFETWSQAWLHLDWFSTSMARLEEMHGIACGGQIFWKLYKPLFVPLTPRLFIGEWAVILQFGFVNGAALPGSVPESVSHSVYVAPRSPRAGPRLLDRHTVAVLNILLE